MKKNILPKNPIADSIIMLHQVRVMLEHNRNALQRNKTPREGLIQRIEQLTLAINWMHDAVRVLHMHEGDDFEVQTGIPFWD